MIQFNMPWEFGFPLSSLVFQIVERFHQWFQYWRMFGKGLQLKTTTLLVLFLWLVKSLKNLLRIGLLITLRTVAFFLIISLVLGLLDQLQISQLYLIDLVGLLTGPGLLELWYLIYPSFLTGFGMLVFTNLSLMEFPVKYLALFLLFSVIDGFDWFWVKSLHKNIQLMFEFLKAPFLVLHISYYTLLTSLTMLYVMFLSILMVLLTIQQFIQAITGLY